MEICLDHIVPAPLAGTFSLHPVWNTRFCLEPGKSYLLNAVSGRGKSTLLNILHGSRPDFSGTLLFDGETANDWDLAKWTRVRRDRLSFVFQDLRLFPQLSARENLEIKCRLSPEPQKFLDRIPEYTRLLGLEPLMDKPCRTLSFGQQQRLAIVRALLQDFDYLLLDEPFSHLDEANIRIVCDLLLKEMTERRSGMVLSSLGYDYPYPFTERIAL